MSNSTTSASRANPRIIRATDQRLFRDRATIGAYRWWHGRGMLFLGELPKFGQTTLEALRQPLEDHIATSSHARGAVLEIDIKPAQAQ